MNPKPSEWSDEETEQMLLLYRRAIPTREIAKHLKRPYKSVESKIFRVRSEGTLPTRQVVSDSGTPEWNDPVEAEGDALIIPDMETPYHHAGFVNKAVDLALSWGITQVILAGDFVHFANFSQWAPDFQIPKASDKQSVFIEKLIAMLPADKRDAAASEAEKNNLTPKDGGISAEMAGVRQTVKELESAFGRVYYIMGNHERRKLRFQNYGEEIDELLRFLEANREKWTASPYYWCRLRTEAPFTYRVEHPISASRIAAMDLAIQTQEHIIMGHSHRWAMNRDPSGRLWAIQAGHCVDEMRLQYVQQRSAKRDAHALGAVIVRGGYPYLLSENTPFDAFKKM